MRQRFRVLLLLSVALGLVLCVGISVPQAQAWDCYCAPTVQYYVPPPSYVYVPQPVVVYPAPTVVYRPYVVAPPVASYVVAPMPYWYTERYRGRPWDYEYKYKVYSPFKRGPVYEYEVDVDRGRIKIEHDFD